MATALTYAHIVRTPGICGGRPRLEGHRIRVQDIVVLYEHHHMSPEEIGRQYPSLSLAQIHYALAYFFDHRAEIEADLAEEARIVAELKQKNVASVR